MAKEQKQILVLFAIAIVMLFLLWANQRRIKVASGEAEPLVPGEIMPANYNFWLANPNPLQFQMPDFSLVVNELYYTKSLCGCKSN